MKILWQQRDCPLMHTSYMYASFFDFITNFSSFLFFYCQGAKLDPGNGSVKVAAGVKPVHFEFKGNYGVAVHWSDGYTHDIFPYDVLKDIAEEVNAA